MQLFVFIFFLTRLCVCNVMKTKTTVLKSKYLLCSANLVHWRTFLHKSIYFFCSKCFRYYCGNWIIYYFTSLQCQNHLDCCSRNCLTFSYKCIRERSTEADLNFVNRVPDVAGSGVGGSVNSVQELVDRFGGDENNRPTSGPPPTPPPPTNLGSLHPVTQPDITAILNGNGNNNNVCREQGRPVSVVFFFFKYKNLVNKCVGYYFVGIWAQNFLLENVYKFCDKYRFMCPES